ncbi:MAG: NAD(P)(+) transhydrogenase (Re/Si-specific) subunit alpha, partial [Gemmatimonadetes bacterium]|nr:NAD(P)(+) transhydrogenase (Re/Si-specific) subunit alpha [Gemmatimonadota bacterium]NIU72204.1 NAD(P)(+) transhydrogenase (Re/Si-specific) subunit alpha [Gammaproteobacteria bacterium]NIX43734.1 NAD(P)(+) transhydrogenase (Re/Si-specific) subunit alpha [Gemmatimonadota bacterium]NIY07927.1 NAD(P)(+) transhydrogenase (Re/Si-specific) subunit alpha [Gemmatimonadota bacterium]
MKVAVLKETRAGERRVALVPQGVKALVKAGMEVSIEAGAGLSAGIEDDAFRESGATVAPSAADALRDAGMVLRVNPPSLADPDEVSGLAEGSILVSFLDPLGDPALIRKLAERRISSIS